MCVKWTLIAILVNELKLLWETVQLPPYVYVCVEATKYS